MQITILGAGVTGLTLARLLAEDGHEVRVLERDGVAGGLCRSSTIDGFVCDHAGGHILFSKDEATRDWMIDRVGRDNVVASERETRILWHDRYVPYPFENGIGALTAEAKFDCLKGYLEADRRRKAGEPCPADFGAWITWKMGEGFAEHFMRPYNEKIWKCDLGRMASDWVAGRVPDAPVDDILRAAVGIETSGYEHQARFWFPRSGGFQALTDGIARGIEGRIELRTPVERVARVGERFAVNGDACDLVINTIPLPELAPALDFLPEGLAEEIAQLRPISLVNVVFGVERDEALPPRSWIYLPFANQGPANRVTFFSNYSPENAPAGHASFMAEVTFRGKSPLSETFLGDLARSLEERGLFDRDKVVLSEPFVSRYAYIDQDLAFAERIAAIRAWFDASGLLTVGRFGRYEYHNSDQCIQRAFETRAHVARLAETGDRLPLVLG